MFPDGLVRSWRSYSQHACANPSVGMRNFVFALALMGVAASVPRVRRDSTPFYVELPANASLILGNIQAGFDCADLPYGYYADEANNCAIFHVCLPYINFGEIVTRQFSFMCGEGTVFDQERFVCDAPQTSLPCSQSTFARKANEYFGRLDINFNE